MSRVVTESPRAVASTDIRGLDDILVGGFTRNRLYLVEGMPGTGKTTLALQYLTAGAAAGVPVLYVTLSETEEELRAEVPERRPAIDMAGGQELVGHDHRAQQVTGCRSCNLFAVYERRNLTREQILAMA